MYNIPNTTGEISGQIPVAAGVIIQAGGLFGVNASGYAVPIAAAGVTKVVGRADFCVDNTEGVDGETTIHGMRSCMHLDNSADAPLTHADFGKEVYAEDPQTVRQDQTDAEPVAGVFIGFDSSGLAMVDIRRA